MEIFRKKRAEKARYILVGITNTTIDFGLLFFINGLGIDKITANYISTSTAFLFSFVVNKNYTFKSKSSSAKREFGLFTLVTLTGLWIIQPITIALSSGILELMFENQQVNLAIAKLLATGITLVWNYVLYSRVVFKKGIL